MESALIQAGLDPYIGILHTNRYAKPVFVYDFIEKYRYLADEVVLELCKQKLFAPEMFAEQQNGALWLDLPAKKILVPAIQDRLDAEKFPRKILADARKFAKERLLDAQKNASKTEQIAEVPV